jgi:hypothetical protein
MCQSNQAPNRELQFVPMIIGSALLLMFQGTELFSSPSFSHIPVTIQLQLADGCCEGLAWAVGVDFSMPPVPQNRTTS